MFVEFVTNMILEGNLSQARREIEADQELPKYFNKQPNLNFLQMRDLLQAIDEAEMLCENVIYF